MVYTIFELSKAGFTFNLTAEMIILEGQVYKSKQGAKKGVLSVQTNSGDLSKYRVAKNRFSLRAGNNRRIGQSPKMSKEKLEEAMSLLQQFGKEAKVIYADKTEAEQAAEKQKK